MKKETTDLVPWVPQTRDDIEFMGQVLHKSGVTQCQHTGAAVAMRACNPALGKFIDEHNIIKDKHGKVNFSVKSEVLHSRLHRDGGRVEWMEISPKKVSGKFFHKTACPDGKIFDMTIDEARKRGIVNDKKRAWVTNPERMLKHNVVAQAVSFLCPWIKEGAIAEGDEWVDDRQEVTAETVRDAMTEAAEVLEGEVVETTTVSAEELNEEPPAVQKAIRWLASKGYDIGAVEHCIGTATRNWGEAELAKIRKLKNMPWEQWASELQ